MPHRPEDIGKGVDRFCGPRGEIYIEYIQVGQTMKVTAVDAATGTEVVIMGPVSATQSQLQKVAVQKLQMQLKKAESEGEAEDSAAGGAPATKGWTA